MSLCYLRTVNYLRMRVRAAADRLDEGATAVEYGLLAALIAVVIITGVTLLGDNLNTMFERLAGEVGRNTPPAAGG